MFEAEVRAALRDAPLSGLRVLNSTTSTNDEALAWTSQGASDLSLVVADEQTAGRGRSGRDWFTPRGKALACSLILKPPGVQSELSGRLAGLGALAVAEACAQLGLVPSIKWPNDVLVRGHKVAGVLVESMWSGNHLEASVLGIGVNVLQGSYPSRAGLSYPATTLEAELRRRPDRADFLRAVIASIMRWRPSMASDEFLRTWESNLAFRGQQVVLTRDEEAPLIGILLGLEPDGSLRLEANQRTIRVQMGEIHLSAANDRIA